MIKNYLGVPMPCNKPVSCGSYYCSKHASNDTISTEIVLCQAEVEETDQFNKEFSSKVECELGKHVVSLKQYERPVPTESEILGYREMIVNRSLDDTSYKRMTEEDGNPRNWLGGWIREFIVAHSDFYDKWPIDD
jgi:hypothetical protein